MGCVEAGAGEGRGRGEEAWGESGGGGRWQAVHERRKDERRKTKAAVVYGRRKTTGAKAAGTEDSGIGRCVSHDQGVRKRGGHAEVTETLHARAVAF
jgi:hypothetical protein